VAAIAQQVSLVSSLAKPLQSKFDLRRFWEHSVGCAMVADRLVSDGHVHPAQPVEYNQYWIACLLHDIGKLLLGFLAYDYFDEVLGVVATRQIPFGVAEEQLGHDVTHQYLARLLLLGAGAGETLAGAVSCHDTVGGVPSALAALVHVASNMCKTMGLGYFEPEPAVYSPAALDTLGTNADELNALAEELAEAMTAEIEELVEQTAPA